MQFSRLFAINDGIVLRGATGGLIWIPHLGLLVVQVRTKVYMYMFL